MTWRPRDVLLGKLLQGLEKWQYPAQAPTTSDVVAGAGKDIEQLGTRLEKSLQGENALEELAELIPRWTMANPAKAFGGLLQVREPEIRQMADVAKQVLEQPKESALAVGKAAVGAVKDPMSTAQKLSLSDMSGFGSILSKVGMAVPGAIASRQVRKLKPDESPDAAKVEKRDLAENVLIERREEVSDLFAFPAKEIEDASVRRQAIWPQGSGANGKLKVLSLFDGLGGARVALNNLDAPVEYMASEIDPYAIKVHRRNYPDTQHIGDVSKVSGQSVGAVDLLVGGSPCQDLSRAKKGGLGLEGPNSQLFYDYVRMLKETNPKYFVFENVASMKPEVKEQISRIFGVEPIMIDAKDVSAQNRKRYFWTNIPVDLPRGRDIKIQDVLEKEVDPKYLHTDKAKAYMQRRVRDGRTHLDFGHHTDARTQQKSRTLTANLRKGVPYNVLIDESGRMRKFTPTEVERLAGVPEGYTEGVSDTQRYKMLGNGFQIQVMEHILSGIPKTTGVK